MNKDREFDAPGVPLPPANCVYRADVLRWPEMLSTTEAGELMGVSPSTVTRWIRSGRAIGLTGPRRAYAVPRWQFESAIWATLEHLAEALQSTDGWTLLWFLDSPHAGLGGKTPKRALEQGVAIERVLDLAGS